MYAVINKTESTFNMTVFNDVKVVFIYCGITSFRKARNRASFIGAAIVESIPSHIKPL